LGSSSENSWRIKTERDKLQETEGSW